MRYVQDTHEYQCTHLSQSGLDETECQVSVVCCLVCDNKTCVYRQTDRILHDGKRAGETAKTYSPSTVLPATRNPASHRPWLSYISLFSTPYICLSSLDLIRLALLLPLPVAHGRLLLNYATRGF